MQYMLLIYASEAQAHRPHGEDRGALNHEYFRFTEELKASGHFHRGERLEPVKASTTVRVKDGQVLRSDGPVVQSREPLGGFYIVEAKNYDEAVALAARLPAARVGCVEVRPIMKLSTM